MGKKGTGKLKPGSRNTVPVSPDMAGARKKRYLRSFDSALSILLNDNKEKVQNLQIDHTLAL